MASSLEVAGAASPERVCVGAIAGAHGVRGTIRVRSFTVEPADIAAYGMVSDEAGGRQFELELVGASGGDVLVRIDGVDDRDAAEALKGLRLYVPRSALPPLDDDECYHGDLLGLVAELKDGTELGTVVAVMTIGETEVLEVDRGSGRTKALVPFTRAAVPVVDIAGRRLVVDPSAGLIEPDDGGGEGRR